MSVPQRERRWISNEHLNHFQLNILKKEQTKPSKRKEMKITAETNEIETREIQKVNEAVL